MRTQQEFLELLGLWNQLPKDRQAYLLGYTEGLVRLEPGWPEVREPRRQREDLKPGDRVLVFSALAPGREEQTGTVTYIHPLHRYYTVDLDQGCRESFPWGWAE